MLKNKYIYPFIAIVLIGLTACSDSESESDPEAEADSAIKKAKEALAEFEKKAEAYCDCLAEKSETECEDLYYDVSFELSEEIHDKLDEKDQNMVMNEMGFIMADVEACLIEAKEASAASVDMEAVKSELANWSKTNLNVTQFRNGDKIQVLESEEEWEKAADAGEPACCKPKTSNYSEDMGLLYNWYAVNDPRGLAPEGWKIPGLEDWNALLTPMGDVSNAYDILADTTNFAAMPVGIRLGQGRFTSMGMSTHWWTSDPVEENPEYSINAFYMGSSKIEKRDMSFGSGASVRCVKE